MTTKRRTKSNTAVPALGRAGKELVKSIKQALGPNHELDEREEALLQLAARQADDVARLEADLRKRGTTVVGSQGQPVLNGALSEARQGRLALQKILASIELPKAAK